MKPNDLDPRRVVAYCGYRAGGAAHVLRLHADGTASPLPPRLDLRRHSPDGFNWGYGGSGPAQLALAVLADQLPDCPDDARQLYQHFKAACVARITADAWALTAAQVSEWLMDCAVTLEIAANGEGGDA